MQGGKNMTATNVPLEERKFFTYEEFGRLIGVNKHTVYMWVRRGYLRAARFSPKCVMIPRGELERYERGEMMPSGEPGSKGEK
jgi:excisionase family DNA binding protein